MLTKPICMRFIIVTLLVIGSWAADEWVDPNDMIHFDHSSMSNRHSNAEVERSSEKLDHPSVKKSLTPKPEESNVRTVITVDLPNIKADVAEKVKKNHSMEKNETTKKCPACQDSKFYNIFMRRIIVLWESKVNVANSHAHYNAILQMSRNDLEILHKFTSSDKVDINDAHDIINRMFVEIQGEVGGEQDTREPAINFLRLHSYLANWGVLVVVLLTCSVHIVRLRIDASLVQVIYKLFLLSFLLSVPMTWYHMYKKEEANQMTANVQQMPVECEGENMSYSSMVMKILKSFVSVSSDPCLVYHERVMIDPVFKVSITEAISMTVVNLFLSPLSNIGKAFGKFLVSMLEPMPPILWPVPIALIILAMFMYSGYSVRVPFILTIEKSQKQAVLPPVDDKHKLSEIDNKISSMLDLLQLRSVPQSIEQLHPMSRDCGDGIHMIVARGVAPNAMISLAGEGATSCYGSSSVKRVHNVGVAPNVMISLAGESDTGCNDSSSVKRVHDVGATTDKRPSEDSVGRDECVAPARPHDGNNHNLDADLVSNIFDQIQDDEQTTELKIAEELRPCDGDINREVSFINQVENLTITDRLT